MEITELEKMGKLMRENEPDSHQAFGALQVFIDQADAKINRTVLKGSRVIPITIVIKIVFEVKTQVFNKFYFGYS
jgi:hypothetical protein